MKLLFVVNPISGGVDKEPFLIEARALCINYGIKYEIFKTTGTNDEAEVQKAIDAFKPTRVVSIGGDGTTLFTAIALLNLNIPMGIIPLGSANGMAVELSVNLNPLEALKDILMSNVIEGLDMLLINDKHYTMHIGDVGLNASIVEAYEKDENRGMATYAKYFIEALKTLSPFKVTVNANGKSVSSHVLMTAICNARKYGTGVPLNKLSNPMDGQFEIVLIEEVNFTSLIKAGLSKFDEQFMDDQSGQVIAAESAEIIFDKPRLLQLDGEVIDFYKEIKIEMLKGAVQLISTKSNTYISAK
ncbi:diacylglycerol/lipid kinase family protein [Saccharicrinis aurantiacus]|uniref:diacylglycerol/lipid kinase family protein n=1 Tax=Saccharicrinis aurantiacus TaxID=1849719 RepID=UPI00248F7C04|nr:diacylglycerol kinase family protein [Saccharicrinis aurantiacus]